jgi:ATP-dependent DNA helicase RecG
LKKELNIFTFKDLLNFFPNRHIDKTKVATIKEINFQSEFIQVAGKLENLQIFGEGRSKRLVGYLKDSTGVVELVWFQGINWVIKNFNEGSLYLVLGKLDFLIINHKLFIQKLSCLFLQMQMGKHI